MLVHWSNNSPKEMSDQPGLAINQSILCLLNAKGYDPFL